MLDVSQGVSHLACQPSFVHGLLEDLLKGARVAARSDEAIGLTRRQRSDHVQLSQVEGPPPAAATDGTPATRDMR